MSLNGPSHRMLPTVGSQPRTQDAMIMYPLLLMGSSSVKPCMNESVATWMMFMAVS